MCPREWKACEGKTTNYRRGTSSVSIFVMSFFETPPSEQAFLTVTPKLNIVYEDENILLVNKPAGLVVHDDESNTPNTLIAQIQSYLYQKGEYLPERENTFAPALCNRIDRNTEGIVIAAKNAQTLRIMNQKN